MRAAVTVIVVAALATAAHADSKYHLKIGEKPSDTKDTCDGAHDQCLPIEAVFVWYGTSTDDATIKVVLPKQDGGYWSIEHQQDMPADVHPMKTARATAGNVKVGALVLVFANGEPPSSELDAVDTAWHLQEVAKLDGDTVTVTDRDARPASLDAVRVITAGAPPPPAQAPAVTAVHNPRSRYHYQRPGDRLSQDPDTCDGAHDHCLPAEVQLAIDPDYPRDGRVVLDTPDGAYDLTSEATFKDRYTLFETEAATAASLKKGDTVFCYGIGEGLPSDEFSAVRTEWMAGKVDAVDGKVVTIGKAHAELASCRRVRK